MSVIASAVRSFVDLRAFAAAAQPATRSWPDGDAFLAARRCLALPAGAVSVAVLDLADAGDVASLPADEFLIVLSGALEVASAGHRIALARGEAGVLPGGVGFAWRAQRGTRAIVMRCASGEPGAQAPIRIDEQAPLSPSAAPRAELLLSPTPSCRNFTAYRSANGEFECGVWDSTPYRRTAMEYRHYELMHLLEGSVTLADGRHSRTFVAGDIFLVEQHALCSWDSRVHVKKVYAIHRPG